MESYDDAPDPIDAALARPAPSAADVLRKQLLGETLSVIRRRRRLKRATLVAGLFGCYLAGITTMGAWQSAHGTASGTTAGLSSGASQPATPSTASEQVAHGSVSAGRSGTAAGSSGSARQPATPGTACKQVAHGGVPRLPTAFESWRNIGDYYFREKGDISLAAAGYAQALDLATEAEQAIAPDRDSWLLMAMKDARAKEKQYAYAQSN